ncbi:MAG: hypothetical protein QOD51_3 [Candidatus Eremiobacteraeota bacterium]|nr:hypothetical protein [Candidatus Eremiobacteraeota bacterium]
MMLLASAGFSAALDVSSVSAPYARARIPVAADPTPGFDYRDLRVRDDRGRDVPYALDPGPRRRQTVAVRTSAFERPADAPTEQRATIDLGAPNLAVTSVRVDTSTPAFERDAVVDRSDDGATWTASRRERIARFREGAPNLVLATGDERARFWRVTIDDRDDAPLRDLRVTVFVQAHDVVFPVVRGRRYALTFGDPELDAPAYDLPARLSHERWRADTASVGRVVELRRRTPRELANTARPLAAAPVAAPSAAPAWLAPVAFGVAVVVLALFALRLTRAPETARPEGE